MYSQVMVWKYSDEQTRAHARTFDENGRKFSKRVENTVGKGEIACHEQFLLSPQSFQMASTADT